MTAAERQRRHRAGLAAGRVTPSGPVNNSEEKMAKKRKSYHAAYGKRVGEALYITHLGVMDSHRHGDATDQAEAHAIHDLIKNNFPKLPKQKLPKKPVVTQKTP
jgi:hypothetical protein